MSSIDDLLAQRASGGVASLAPAAPASVPAASGGLDALLASRAAGQTMSTATQPSAAAEPSLMDFLTHPIQSAARSPSVAAAGSAFVHHLGNMAVGIPQLVENGAAKLFGLTGDNPVSRYASGVAASDNAAVNAREAAYQQSTPDGIPATLGAAAGEVVPLIVGGIPKALNAAGDYVGAKVASLIPSSAQKLGAKLASAGTQGAAVSAAQPVDTSPDLSSLVTGESAPGYWASKASSMGVGAALGAAIPGGAGLVGAAARGVKNAIAPVFAPANVVAPQVESLLTQGGKIPLQSVIDALRRPSALVQDSQPTTAQVLASSLDGGHPQAVMAEKTVANTPEGKILFTDRDNANNGARIASLKGMAGTPEDLDTAIQVRRDSAAPAIDKMLADPAQNPTVLSTSQPIRARSITDKIDALAATSFGTDPVVAKTLRAIRQQVGDAAANTDVSAYTYTPTQLASLQDEPYVRPDLLDGIRQNLRNTISDNASNGAVSSKQEAGLQPLADHITSAIERANPGYRDYLATYARNSQPINAMEAAGGILDDVAGAGRGANSAGDAQVTLPRVATALGKALRGSPYALDPATQAGLEAIQSDLQRASISGSVRQPGSDTAFNLQAPGWLAGKIYGSDMSGGGNGAKLLASALGAMGGFHGGLMGAAGGAAAGGAAASKLNSIGQQRTAAMLAKVLAEPQYAADLLQQAQQAKAAIPSPGVSARIPQMNLLLGQALGQRNP